MDCTATSAHKFKTKLGFKQYDVILTKEQSVLTKIMSSFEGKNTETQCNVLGYRIDTATEILSTKIKRQKAIERELGCRFIGIDPDKEDFNILRAVNQIFRHIKQSTKII